MRLFRYLLESKFDDLLKTSQIYQSPLTVWGDSEVPEGIITAFDEFIISGKAEWLDILMCHSAPSATGERGTERAVIKEMWEKVGTEDYTLMGRKFNRAEHDVNETLARLRRHMFISCWTKSTSEQSYMWDEYGRDKRTGSRNSVRIETSRELLTSALQHDDLVQVSLDNVAYLDYDTEVSSNKADTAEPYFSKPSVYDGKPTKFPKEDEFRVVSHLKDFDIDSTSPEYMRINVDLTKLISEVKVNPEATSDYKLKVAEQLEQAGLSQLLAP